MMSDCSGRVSGRADGNATVFSSVNAVIEAALFAAGELPVEAFCAFFDITPAECETLLDNMKEEMEAYPSRGLRLARHGNMVQLATPPELADAVKTLVNPPASVSLSQALLDTLAVVAYKQPVTRLDVERLRGVNCDYTMQTLAARGLIAEVGRSEGLGRARLYGTTDKFLQHFGMAGLHELPDASSFRSQAESKPHAIFPSADGMT